MIDRHYSRSPSDDGPYDFRPQSRSWFPWAVAVAVLAAIFVFALAPVHWFPPRLAAVIERGRAGTALAAPSSSPSTQAPRLVAQAPAQVTRCIVNGTAIDVVGSRCPAAAPLPSPALPALQRPVEAQPTPDNPFVKPGTIYRCRSYSGGLFWAQAHCSQHKALIDRIASVPVGMPFQQQVDIASAEAGEVERTIQREKREGERAALCSSLQQERDLIWKRSGSGAGVVALDQLGRDQTRWRQIEGLLNANGCRR